VLFGCFTSKSEHSPQSSPSLLRIFKYTAVKHCRETPMYSSFVIYMHYSLLKHTHLKVELLNEIFCVMCEIYVW
jgi:hypothetical protein